MGMDVSKQISIGAVVYSALNDEIALELMERKLWNRPRAFCSQTRPQRG